MSLCNNNFHFQISLCSLPPQGLPSWLSGKESVSFGVGNGNPPLYSFLGNGTDRGAWQATVHRVERVEHDRACTHSTPPHTLSIIVVRLLIICSPIKLFIHLSHPKLCCGQSNLMTFKDEFQSNSSSLLSFLNNTLKNPTFFPHVLPHTLVYPDSHLIKVPEKLVLHFFLHHHPTPNTHGLIASQNCFLLKAFQKSSEGKKQSGISNGLGRNKVESL